MYMKVLDNKELLEISGGGSLLTASFLTAASRLVSTIFDIGKSFGTSIVRHLNGSYCSVSK